MKKKFIIDCKVIMSAGCLPSERLSWTDQRSRDGLRDERDFDWSYGNDDPMR